MRSDAPTHQEYDARESKIEPIKPALVHVPSITDSNASNFRVGQFNQLKMKHHQISAPVHKLKKRSISITKVRSQKPVLGRISSHQPQEPQKYEFELDSDDL